MEKLLKKMTEMGKDLKLLINTKGVFENDDHWDKKGFDEKMPAK
jgi:hypothetical protein